MKERGGGEEEEEEGGGVSVSSAGERRKQGVKQVRREEVEEMKGRKGRKEGRNTHIKGGNGRANLLVLATTKHKQPLCKDGRKKKE